MVFPRNALASGPHACFLAEKRIAKVKVGEHGIVIAFARRVMICILSEIETRRHQKISCMLGHE
jgi:hypothetical protein